MADLIAECRKCGHRVRIAFLNELKNCAECECPFWDFWRIKTPPYQLTRDDVIFLRSYFIDPEQTP